MFFCVFGNKSKNSTAVVIAQPWHCRADPSWSWCPACVRSRELASLIGPETSYLQFIYELTYALRAYVLKEYSNDAATIPAARVPKREFARRLEIVVDLKNENREPFSSTKVKQLYIYKICFLVFIWILDVIMKSGSALIFFFKSEWRQTTHTLELKAEMTFEEERLTFISWLSGWPSVSFTWEKAEFHSKIYFIFIVLNLETNV